MERRRHAAATATNAAVNAAAGVHVAQPSPTLMLHAAAQAAAPGGALYPWPVKVPPSSYGLFEPVWASRCAPSCGGSDKFRLNVPFHTCNSQLSNSLKVSVSPAAHSGCAPLRRRRRRSPRTGRRGTGRDADLPQGHPALPQRDRLSSRRKCAGRSAAKSHILEVERARVLRLPVGSFRGPVERCRGTRGRHMRECIAEEYTPRVYNPSIVPASAALRVASVRVTSTSATRRARSTGFEGAAIVSTPTSTSWRGLVFQIRGGNWRIGEVLGVGTRGRGGERRVDALDASLLWRAARRTVELAHVRVFTHGPSLMATFQCRACEAFNVPAVQPPASAATAEDYEACGLELASHPAVAHHPLREQARYREEAAYWLAGANQGLFLDGSDPRVQSWLGHVVELGSMGVAVEPPARQGASGGSTDTTAAQRDAHVEARAAQPDGERNATPWAGMAPQADGRGCARTARREVGGGRRRSGWWSASTLGWRRRTRRPECRASSASASSSASRTTRSAR